MIVLYLCYDCYWPICFPYGQKMHIGTGWYCWEKIQENGRADRTIKFKFDGFVKSPTSALRCIPRHCNVL